MNNSLKVAVTICIAVSTILAGTAPRTSAFARSPREGGTPTETATSTALAVASDTPSTPAIGTPTPTRFVVKPIVHNPTPIPGTRKQIILPKAVVLDVGTKNFGIGLSQKLALQKANTFVPSLFVLAPTFIPRGYTLQLVHVDPAQDQQTPATVYLQYIPKGLSIAHGTYASFYVTKRLGTFSVLYPGVKPQVVTINRGKKGIGVVKGTIVDIKPKNGNEVVHILWTRISLNYDVSSNVSVSKLGIKDLLAVAATVQ